MINIDSRGFIFGLELSPPWFLEKLDCIEYIYKKGRVVGCNIQTINGELIKKQIGERIDIGLLYEENEYERNSKC